MAKQDPTLTPAYLAGSEEIPLFYAGCNGAFFGPRACALSSVMMKRHGFAGLAGPANVTASYVTPLDGSLRVTATGGVRVGVIGRWYGTQHCTPINGTEVPVEWIPPPNKPNDKPLPIGKPLGDLVGGAVGLMFEIPRGAVLYAWHL
jgi:hypothetical protein